MVRDDENCDTLKDLYCYRINAFPKDFRQTVVQCTSLLGQYRHSASGLEH